MYWEVHIIQVYVQKSVHEMLVIKSMKNKIIYDSFISLLHCPSI